MKIPFIQLSNRITGISTPVFGISWNPPQLDIDIAKHLIIFLEDQRILYNPLSVEIPLHAVYSIMDIRKRLTEDMEQSNPSSPLYQSLAAMRASCRKFLDIITITDKASEKHLVEYDPRSQVIFTSALGELRGVLGIHIAKICIEYGIDVEEQLAFVFPSSPEE